MCSFLASGSLFGHCHFRRHHAKNANCNSASCPVQQMKENLNNSPCVVCSHVSPRKISFRGTICRPVVQDKPRTTRTHLCSHIKDKNLSKQALTADILTTVLVKVVQLLFAMFTPENSTIPTQQPFDITAL